ncbi:MAG: hypothetical protein KGH69_04760 [Candidatus Micrarchaeota archaeon]|nr:hypothetical protein [Candidatus Micrarchaeota archaeon]
METGSMVLYIAVVAIIIGIVYFASSVLLHTQKRSTPAQLPSPPSPNGQQQNRTAANVSFYTLNVQYVYDGRLFKNGRQCDYTSYTFVDDSQIGRVNGSGKFYIELQPSSSGCSMTITSISNYTTGFKVVSTEPVLPLYMPPDSQMAIQVELQAPSAYFYGPLTITVHYK